jgi:hypothetical protein
MVDAVKILYVRIVVEYLLSFSGRGVAKKDEAA